MFTVLSIKHRANGCECGIYERLIGIYLHIVNKFYCGGGVLFEGIKVGEDVIKLGSQSLIRILALF